MRIVDRSTTIAWMGGEGLLPVKDKGRLEDFLGPANFAIPCDSGKKAVLSRAIVSWLREAPSDGKQSEGLLWIDEYGIWPSGEIWCLFDGFRRSLGEHRPLYERPGHFFTDQDLPQVEALLAMVLYFSWGAVLVSQQRHLVVRISHDEQASFFARDRGVLTAVEQFFQKLTSK